MNIDPGRVETHRWEFVAADTLTDPILVPGGFGQFAEYCPGHTGCLAVEYAGNGTVLHAYPYRPEEIEKTTSLVAFPYEQPLGFSMRNGVSPRSGSQYANGDLLVSFSSPWGFPHGRGVARIDRDGWPRLYRRDYSLHEPYIAKDDVALVPSMLIGRGPSVYRSRSLRRTGPAMSQCENSFLDFVHVIDGEGRLLKEISVLDALLESSYAPILRHSDPCNPTHVNFVHKVSGTVGGH